MKKFLLQNDVWDKEGLAKEVLKEVPNQVVRWMVNKGLKPLKA